MERLSVWRRRIFKRKSMEHGSGELFEGRRNWHLYRGGQWDMHPHSALQRQAVAVLLYRPRRILSGTFALARFVAARLVLAGKHEVLFT